MTSFQQVAVLTIVYFVIGVTSLVRLHPLKQWGIVSVEGEDRLRFLHGLGTNSFVDKVNGDCFPNCFLNAQAKLLFYNQCFVTPTAVKFIFPSISNNIIPLETKHFTLETHFKKFLFPADKVSIRNEQDSNHIMWVESTSSSVLLDTLSEALKLESHQIVNLGGYWSINPSSSSVSRDEMITILPYSNNVFLLVSSYASPLTSSSSIEILNDEMWEYKRVVLGYPIPSSEIHLQHTPLEAGLMPAIHFNKGCFVGQEILSKVVQTNAIRQKLVGLTITTMDGSAHEFVSLTTLKNASILNVEGEKVGYVSSVVAQAKGQYRALGYIKSKYTLPLDTGTAFEFMIANEGVVICKAELVQEKLWPSFDIKDSPSPPVPKLASKGKEILIGIETALLSKTPSEDVIINPEEQRKAAKLKAMAEKVAALQAKKKSG